MKRKYLGGAQMQNSQNSDVFRAKDPKITALFVMTSGQLQGRPPFLQVGVTLVSIVI